MSNVVWVFNGEGDGPGPVFNSLDEAYECGRGFCRDGEGELRPLLELRCKQPDEYDDHRYKDLDPKVLVSFDNRLYFFPPGEVYSYYWLQRFELEGPVQVGDELWVLEGENEQIEGVWRTETEAKAVLCVKHGAQSIRLAPNGTPGSYWNVCATTDGVETHLTQYSLHRHIVQ